MANTAVTTTNGETREVKPYPGSPDWVPPTSEQEWKFEGDPLAGPDWIDPGWAGFQAGPVLQVPTGDLWGKGAYTASPARVGDTIKFLPAKGAYPARFVVVPGEEPEKNATKLPAQQSAAQLEDLIKGGYLMADDLGEDAKAQVTLRSPQLAKVVTGEVTIAEKQEPAVTASAA